MKKLTRERVVPTMSASVPWLIFHKPMARGAESRGTIRPRSTPELSGRSSQGTSSFRSQRAISVWSILITSLASRHANGDAAIVLCKAVLQILAIVVRRV